MYHILCPNINTYIKHLELIFKKMELCSAPIHTSQQGHSTVTTLLCSSILYDKSLGDTCQANYLYLAEEETFLYTIVCLLKDTKSKKVPEAPSPVAASPPIKNVTNSTKQQYNQSMKFSTNFTNNQNKSNNNSVLPPRYYRNNSSSINYKNKSTEKLGGVGVVGSTEHLSLIHI